MAPPASFFVNYRHKVSHFCQPHRACQLLVQRGQQHLGQAGGRAKFLDARLDLTRFMGQRVSQPMPSAGSGSTMVQPQGSHKTNPVRRASAQSSALTVPVRHRTVRKGRQLVFAVKDQHKLPSSVSNTSGASVSLSRSRQQHKHFAVGQTFKKPQTGRVVFARHPLQHGPDPAGSFRSFHQPFTRCADPAAALPRTRGVS